MSEQTVLILDYAGTLLLGYEILKDAPNLGAVVFLLVIHPMRSYITQEVMGHLRGTTSESTSMWKLLLSAVLTGVGFIVFLPFLAIKLVWAALESLNGGLSILLAVLLRSHREFSRRLAEKLIVVTGGTPDNETLDAKLVDHHTFRIPFVGTLGMVLITIAFIGQISRAS